jgi:S-(hydroxymethyl)glutathione dehydrogenase/alcohol dehydrogenase
MLTRPSQLATGRRWPGTAFGSVKGCYEPPSMVEGAMAGKFQLAPLATQTMPLTDINEAFELMQQGKSIRPVVRY